MRYFIDNIKTYASVNKKGRALQIYVQQFDRHLIADECSLDASELGSVVEEVKVSVVDDRNRELHLAICHDYSKDKMTLHLTGKNPDNLKEASGLYARLMNLFIGSLKETREL